MVSHPWQALNEILFQLSCFFIILSCCSLIFITTVSLQTVGKAPSEQLLKRVNMTRACRIFTRICEHYLGLPETICHYNYTEKEKVFAEKLLEDIMRVGNFGKATDYGKKKGWIGSIINYWMIVKRCYALGYLCPSEAKYWPFCKFIRFFEKKANPEKFQ